MSNRVPDADGWILRTKLLFYTLLLAMALWTVFSPATPLPIPGLYPGADQDPNAAVWFMALVLATVTFDAARMTYLGVTELAE